MTFETRPHDLAAARRAAERAVVEYARQRGFLTPQQLEQARQAFLSASGEGALLPLLRPFLQPEHQAELRQVYDRAIATPAAPAPTPSPPPLRGPLALADTAQGTAGLPSGSSLGAKVAWEAGGRIGPFVIERELGRGGMGVVLVGRHAELGRRVALKLMLVDEESGATGEALARFDREARAVAALDHPAIVRIHEVGSEGWNPYLAMDLIDGEGLDVRLKREGRLDPREAATIAERLARALAHAHERGILHRDLKPANVLLDRQHGPKLTDFGLAKLDDERDRLTRTGVALGTPAYMPPEQAAGEKERVGPRSDVYGLGATLYTLVTGRPPFTGPTALNIVNQVLGRPAERPSSHSAAVDPDLEAVILQCLEKEPEDRYPSAAALADDLQRWLEGRPVVAARPSRRRRLRQWVRRHRVLAAATAVGLVCLVLASGAAGTLFLLHLRAQQDAAARARAQKEIESLLSEGEAALGAGDFRQSREHLLKAIDLGGPSPRGLVALGEAERGIGSNRFPQAKEALRAAVALSPPLALEQRAWRALLAIGYAEEDLTAATVCLDRLVELEPGAVRWWDERARCKEQLDDPRGAAADLTAALERLDPTAAERERALIERRLRMRRVVGDWKAALADLDALLSNRQARLDALEESKLTGEAGVAEARARAIADARARVVELLLDRAQVLQMVEDHEAASAVCESAIKMAPSSYEAYLTAGLIGVRAHRRTAGSDLQRAIELRPTSAVAYALRARAAHYEVSAPQLLERMISAALQHSEGGDRPPPGSGEEETKDVTELRRGRALAYATKALVDRRARPALALADKALRLDPQCDLALTVRAQSLLALAEAGQGGSLLDEALSSVEAAVALAPIDIGAHWTRCRVLRGLGRREDALQEAEWVLRMDGWHLDAAGAVIDLALALDQPPRALQAANMLIDSGMSLNKPSERGRLLSTGFARRAVVHLAMGDLARALGDVERSHLADVNAWKLNALPQLRIKVLEQIQASGDLIAQIDRFMREDPAQWQLRFSRGVAHEELLQAPEAALADFSALVRDRPGYVPAYWRAAGLHLQAGRREEAIAQLWALVESRGDESIAYGRPALFALNRLKDPKLAVTILDQGLERARDNLGHLLRLRVRAKALLGDRRGAEEDLERLQEMVGLNPSLQYLIRSARRALARGAAQQTAHDEDEDEE